MRRFNYRTGALGAVLTVMALSTGCAKEPPPAVLFGATGDIVASDYDRVLRRWTRSDQVYSGLDHRMFVDATLHSPEFRRAFAIAWPDVYGAGGQVTRRELVELSGPAETTHTFFVSVFTGDRDWNDLADQGSIWRLTLESGPVSVEASEITAIPVDANLRAVYSHIDRFDKCYLVRFPLADPLNRMLVDPSSTDLTMKIASAIGRAELQWQLLPASKSTRKAALP
ncbi:MAG: hypothetical protein AAF658_13465 [Myxococcota bacterium]